MSPLSLFGITWSPATATLRMLKNGIVKPEYLRAEFLNKLDKDLLIESRKFRKKNKTLTREYLIHEIYKDDNYKKLFKELGIESNINNLINRYITKD